MSIDLGKKTGAISLDKGQRVTIEKTRGITASVTFSRETDYDVYAVILDKSGKQYVCSTFGSDAQPNPTDNVLGVRHLGDVVRGGASDRNVETLEVTLSDEVDQIAVVAYSAQSNGTGSFKNYRVSMTVDNGQGTTVTVDADQANDNAMVYTCVPAIIRNTDDGVVIERVEMYSAPSSENRPAFQVAKKGIFNKNTQATLVMDAGSKNKYK